MKIAFWSNSRGVGGVTANTACIAAFAAIEHMGKIVLLENHYSRGSLADIVLPDERAGRRREGRKYYEGYGIEHIVKYLCSGGENIAELLNRTALPLLYSGMYYLPQNLAINREVFDYAFNMSHKELLRNLELFADFVFIDVDSNQNLSSGAILAEADLIVVNLTQNDAQLRDFFDNYSSIYEKSVFLIGAYQPELPLNYHEICRSYNIARDKTETIPYNAEFAEAMSEGRALQFIDRNYENALSRENDYFMRHLKKAFLMIRKKLLNIRMRKCEIYPSFILNNINTKIPKAI